MRPRLTVDAYVQGILSHDRLLLSRAITLAESRLPHDRQLAQQVLERVLPHSGRSLRVGITGVPGVGKSMFIEALGTQLTRLGLRVAVLAIDPSSQRTRGSILGDKTRMDSLSHDPLAYIRPSAAAGALGGVAHRTREAMLLCEAAGFDVVLIETLGVGQSETLVRGMTDFFLLLMLAGAGDELQGIKKGIIEMADALVITKADGPNHAAARLARQEYQNALHLLSPTASGWIPPVLTCSALEATGIDAVWHTILTYQTTTQANGFFTKNRQNQNLDWFHTQLQAELMERFLAQPSVAAAWPAALAAVQRGDELAPAAAQRLLNDYFS